MGHRLLSGPSMDARWVLTYGQLLLRVGYRIPKVEAQP